MRKKLRSLLIGLWMMLILLATFFLASNTYLSAQDNTDTTSVYNSFPFWSPDGDQIAFVSDYAGNMDIWVIEPSGKNPINLTSDNPEFDGDMNWSPNGTHIAFTSERMGKTNIWIMERNGANPKNLTSDMVSIAQGYPRWSSDGSRIAFVSTEQDRFSIWIMNSDGTDKINLTPDVEYSYLVPSWSPDNQHLVLLGGAGNNTRVWLASVDERNLTALTPDDFKALNAQWSPTGDQIVTSNFPDGLWLINSDGTNFINITAGENGLGPIWSPDGRQIAFQSTRKSIDVDLWKINSDGSGETNLTENIFGDSIYPSWSPDGKHIAFTCYCSGNVDIWVMNADGTNPVNLTGERN
jgi:TolB protein